MPLNPNFQIILVDDASTRDYLKDSFENYLKLLPKVRIIRNTERLGLIVSRLIGSRASKGGNMREGGGAHRRGSTTDHLAYHTKSH